MKFLVDAHLPAGICTLLSKHGHDAVHTRDLPAGNATSDATINRISMDEQRVVVSKDADFFYSLLTVGCPWKLLLVRTGNISANDLLSIFIRNLQLIETALRDHSLVEIDRTVVTPVRRE